MRLNSVLQVAESLMQMLLLKFEFFKQYLLHGYILVLSEKLRWLCS